MKVGGYSLHLQQICQFKSYVPIHVFGLVVLVFVIEGELKNVHIHESLCVCEQWNFC